MLALKSLVVASAFALMVHPAIAANDGSGAANGAATCARPGLTPEQRAERKVLREQRLVQGIQPPRRTAEQKARAAARRAARCSNYQPR